jgi:L-threonylcarbamoyladenylate synthase
MEKTNSRIEAAAKLIRAGELVAFPTETVYGLGANALDAGAVAKIYAAKGRPATSPLIVHVDSVIMARELVREWPPQAQLLADKFWAGPLTLVLKKDRRVPDNVTAGLDTVGVRMPANATALELIRAAAVPLAAPSANLFTQVSPTTGRHVRAAFGEEVFVLDEGPTDVGIESTVLSLAGDSPQLLRHGMITREQIETVIGPIGLAGSVPPGAGHASPGMQAKHYSPRTPLILIERELPPGRGAYLYFDHPLAAARTVAMPRDAAAYGAALYAILHEVDVEGWDWIALQTPPGGGEWSAIRDRLERAAAR